MKYFNQILKQFSSSQRIIVLLLLLIFTSGTLIIVQFMKTDDCSSLIEENLKMQKDFIKIVEILRNERMNDLEAPSAVASDSISQYPNTINSILEIASSNVK